MTFSKPASKQGHRGGPRPRAPLRDPQAAAARRGQAAPLALDGRGRRQQGAARL